MLIIPDATLLIQILNFVVFWMLLNLLFIRPTQRAIDQRLRYVAGLYAQADAHAAEAAGISGQAREVLSEAASRAQLVLKEATARAAKETADVEAQSAAEAAGATQAAR
ncbi:MAG: hypothetical protein M3T49_07480, partial [Candidatus Eremiobacteraeota bacterium]|nr:hypothetical protein [Candidatus Eremiobacteraeota bacterium]